MLASSVISKQRARIKVIKSGTKLKKQSLYIESDRHIQSLHMKNLNSRKIATHDKIKWLQVGFRKYN